MMIGVWVASIPIFSLILNCKLDEVQGWTLVSLVVALILMLGLMLIADIKKSAEDLKNSYQTINQFKEYIYVPNMPKYTINAPSISLLQFSQINQYAFIATYCLWAMLLLLYFLKFTFEHLFRDLAFAILSLLLMFAIIYSLEKYNEKYRQILEIFKEYDPELKSGINRRVIFKTFVDKDVIIAYLSLIIILLSGIIFKLLFGVISVKITFFN